MQDQRLRVNGSMKKLELAKKTLYTTPFKDENGIAFVPGEHTGHLRWKNFSRTRRHVFSISGRNGKIY
jgi:hypothetical protein